MQDYNIQLLDDNLEALPIVMEHIDYAKIEHDPERIKELLPTLDVLVCRNKEDKIIGYIALSFITHPFSNRKMATEYGFYCKDKQGSKLLEAAESWVSNYNDAEALIMISYHNLDLHNYYTRKGYTKMETAYIKELN